MIIKELNKAHNLFLRYAQTHPKSLTMGMLGGSTLVGVVLFGIIDDGDDNSYKRDPQQKMSMEEARLIAMLENAKESSWRENVENAIDAQEQFMLPGRQRKEPKFMDRIEQRSTEILRNQHNSIDEEEKRKREKGDDITSYWK
eukprot:CAMPEP_0201216658 /NCGR_PEP_ID=MMETSP0851-20130426/189637_1 /ASSEMBLY_ACC=CAM_ASM_000631 /TAXON_ID=183588 /ORGANISM="Pseudo-nitzschia fraudulenta, Strain WWA7" /LENGTH=142 /DNA_ID=CAMNT_0047506245 /DNA_START=55 /DNA_END=483 /DNA_ORIENTATION=+